MNHAGRHRPTPARAGCAEGSCQVALKVAIDGVGAERVEQSAVAVEIACECLMGALTLDDVGGGVRPAW